MVKRKSPRKGSMQFWPRKRAKSSQARIRSWPEVDGKLAGFAGYKTGMTQVQLRDNSLSVTKGEIISTPVTIIECPPLKPISLRFYKKNQYQTKLLTEITSKQQKIIPEDYDYNTLLLQTQPKLVSGIPKKKPETIEIFIGKIPKEQHTKILEKEIKISDVFEEGQLVDIHAITKGKGFQGPVKRFGVRLVSHKSEKGQRRVGSLGPWNQQQHTMFRVAHAGQTGYHTRVDYNKLLLKIGSDPKEINPKGGFLRYGLIKNEFILLKGSIPGPKKRLIKFINSMRPNKRLISTPEITHINLESQQ